MRPQRINRILNATLRKLGLDKRVKECAILSIWNDAVGEHIALHTRPLKVYNGRITILVENPSWTQELTFLKSEIMEKLNNKMGKVVIKEIYFKIGEINHIKNNPTPRKEKIDWRNAKLEQEKKEKIEESLEKIGDPEIRKILRDFLTKEAKYEQIRDEKELEGMRRD